LFASTSIQPVQVFIAYKSLPPADTWLGHLPQSSVVSELSMPVPTHTLQSSNLWLPPQVPVQSSIVSSSEQSFCTITSYVCPKEEVPPVVYVIL